jgi:pimeloyl-ACP methyl ester carboxylesterase
MHPARVVKKASRAARTTHARARAADGTTIAWTLWSRPSPELVVLAPGFWRVRLSQENRYLAEHLVRRGYDVATLDFRGHGESTGRYSFGRSEFLDLAAVLQELVGEDRPYARFTLVGLSMGGTIAAETLARDPELPCRALIMVSSPADVAALRPKPWRPGALRHFRLRHAVRVPRIDPRSAFGAKVRAQAAVARLTIPKLLVTSERDWLVDPEQGRALAMAAAPPVDYVHFDLPGDLHADALVRFAPTRLLRVLDRWLARHAPA